MKRIGFLGGTFNPIHIGHLAIAHMAMEKCLLDKVIFIPSNWPPHKTAHGLVAASHRYRMVELAIKNHPYFEISDFEIKKEGKSYTIDTMHYFEKQFSPKTKFFFIIGGDLLPELPKWRYIKDLLRLMTFIVVNRPGESHKLKGIPYLSVTMPGIDISSSYIRNRLAQQKTVKYFVPDSVIDYIQKHKLYQ